jgi:hypothetical protein
VVAPQQLGEKIVRDSTILAKPHIQQHRHYAVGRHAADDVLELQQAVVVIKGGPNRGKGGGRGVRR